MVLSVGGNVSLHYENLISDLASTLDLAAGSRLALLPREHESLIADITGVLDLRRALDQVTPEVDLPADEARQRLIDQSADVETLGGMIEWLNSYPLRDRLDFRTHTASPQHSVERECGCAKTRRRMMVLATTKRQKLDFLADGTSTLGSAGLRKALAMLDAALAQAEAVSHPLETDLRNLRATVSAIRHHLADRGTPVEVRDEWDEIARNLDDLESFLNDYTGADLSGENLEEIRLTGIRWSAATTWPPAWRERIVENSTEVAPGIYRIDDDDPGLRGPSDL